MFIMPAKPMGKKGTGQPGDGHGKKQRRYPGTGGKGAPMGG